MRGHNGGRDDWFNSVCCPIRTWGNRVCERDQRGTVIFVLQTRLIITNVSYHIYLGLIWSFPFQINVSPFYTFPIKRGWGWYKKTVINLRLRYFWVDSPSPTISDLPSLCILHPEIMTPDPCYTSWMQWGRRTLLITATGCEWAQTFGWLAFRSVSNPGIDPVYRLE